MCIQFGDFGVSMQLLNPERFRLDRDADLYWSGLTAEGRECDYIGEVDGAGVVLLCCNLPPLFEVVRNGPWQHTCTTVHHSVGFTWLVS